ncbi:MAG: S-layer homology domain-containing protein [Saccharofermentans sp.]|nr:S-layer homology domain-containing protein [Saccharofermentans sp.]
MKFYRSIMFLIALSVGIAIVPGIIVNAASGIKIDEDHFPDYTLRNQVKKSFDKNGNGYLSSDEIKNAKKLVLTSYNLWSLDGIEYLQYLEYLCVDNSIIESIDLSKNTKLKYLYMSFNRYLTDIDCSNNKVLKEIEITNSLLEDIDISKCTKLEKLTIESRQMNSIELQNNKELIELDLTNTAITELDISNNQKIKCLDVDYNALEDGLICACGQKFEQNIVFTGRKVTYNSSNPDVFSAKTVNVNTYSGDTGYMLEFEAKKTGYGTLYYEFAGWDGECSCGVTVLFKDVTNKSDFWFEPTYNLWEREVVKGYDNQTKFKPGNECTRAQMVTFLWRINGCPNPKTKKTSFKDVKSSDYFFKPVIWATEQGITTGYDDGSFRPQNACTRAQTVTFLWRMAGKPVPKSKTCKFTDVKSKDYFYNATIWASDMKIVAGYEDNTFKPQGKCLRRQMVTFLYKYDKYVNGKG